MEQQNYRNRSSQHIEELHHVNEKRELPAQPTELRAGDQVLETRSRCIKYGPAANHDTKKSGIRKKLQSFLDNAVKLQNIHMRREHHFVFGHFPRRVAVVNGVALQLLELSLMRSIDQHNPLDLKVEASTST